LALELEDRCFRKEWWKMQVQNYVRKDKGERKIWAWFNRLEEMGNGQAMEILKVFLGED
jgi:hypothetical protein